MTTRILRTADDIPKLAGFLALRTFPCMVTIAAEEGRRAAQNRLAQRWFSDIARQLADVTHEDVRADCKVTFGVPIMRSANPAWCVHWDAMFGPLGYEAVRAAVKALDVPVTRHMNVRQMSAFMDDMQRFYLPRGIRLTDPEALKYEMEFTT